MTFRCLALSALLSALAATTAFADCSPNPAPQLSKDNFPHLTGKLLYTVCKPAGHDCAPESGAIGYYDFGTGMNVTISQPSWAGWNIYNPHNPIISADEHWVVFTAESKFFDSNNAPYYVFNLFMYRLGSNAQPVNLTNSTGATRNEDPRFSADQTKIVFKRWTNSTTADIVLGNLTWAGGLPSLSLSGNLTQNATGAQSSQPAYATDPAWVYYTKGAGANEQIWYRSAAPGGGHDTLFDGSTGISTYYPVPRNDYRVTYTRWKDGTSQLDQIYQKETPTSTPVQLSFNDCNSNNSDPAPVNGTSYTFFSSNETGRMELYLGDAQTGQRWNLTLFGVNGNTTLVYFGSSYQ